MTQYTPKLLALDIGGVCLRLTPFRTFRFFGINPLLPIPDTLQNCINDYSRGRINSAEFSDCLAQFTKHKFSPQQIKYGWNLFLDTEITATTLLLNHLRSHGWHIVFFSDTQPWHLDKVREILPYSSLIPDGIFSFNVGAEKPDPDMYEAFVNQFGPPELYLDDRAPNVNAGRLHGWRSIRFSEKLTPQLINHFS